MNIAGVEPGKLKLTGELVADIYANKITKWSDPKIAALNNGLKLPDAPITPVYRSDASGTTSIFTTYLSAVSESWKKEFGAATTVSWPAGQGGKGNEGRYRHRQAGCELHRLRGIRLRQAEQAQLHPDPEQGRQVPGPG